MARPPISVPLSIHGRIPPGRGPEFKVDPQKDYAREVGSAGRLQLAPGLVPPTSWSLSPLLALRSIGAQSWSKVQVLVLLISSERDLP
jgi:hypothetical protein